MGIPQNKPADTALRHPVYQEVFVINSSLNVKSKNQRFQVVCSGLKAYRSEVVKNIEVYGEMHRYIPYLAKNAGFEKIGEKVVQHQARKYGQSKFMGLNRFVNGYLDLLTLWFLSTFGKKPMHVFGFLGSIMFFIGFLSVIFIGADKMYALINGIPQRLITDSPWFYIALTTMLIGTQLFLSGFLGDLISRSSQNRNDYQIEKIVK